MTRFSRSHPIITHSSLKRAETRAAHSIIRYTVFPLATVAILWLTSVNAVTFLQVVLSLILIALPWISYQVWRLKDQFGLPLYALISGFHALYFAAPLYWGSRNAPVWYSSDLLVSEQAITMALFMTCLGMVALGLGMRVALIGRLLPRARLNSALRAGALDYIRVLLLVGTFFSFFPGVVYAFGEFGRQWLVLFQETVPQFAAIVLLLRHFRGSATSLDKTLILIYLIARMVTGLGSGWLASIFYLGIAVALTYLVTHKRLPLVSITVVVLVVMFLEPTKGDFRQQYWSFERSDVTVIDRVGYWVNGAVSDWQDAIADTEGQLVTEYVRRSILRVSLLSHSANVLEKTPEIVPFQHGNLYSFALIGLIPRFLWPDKPSGNDANRFYQVAYGVTPEDRLHTVSIAIGFLTEAYISFGWAGVIVIMWLLGIILRGIITFLFTESQNLVSTAIGIVTVTQLFRVEAQLGLYLVSTLQMIVICYLVLLPFLVSGRAQYPSQGTDT